MSLFAGAADSFVNSWLRQCRSVGEMWKKSARTLCTVESAISWDVWNGSSTGVQYLYFVLDTSRKQTHFFVIEEYFIAFVLKTVFFLRRYDEKC